MSNKILLGIDNIARKIKNLFIGVNGIARKVKRIYIGVADKAKLIWEPIDPNTGITWTSRTSANTNWYSVCYAENKSLFVAVGSAGRVMTSP